jgi:hypothetical protein
MLFETELEINALSAYHHDKWTEEDYAIMGKRKITTADDNGNGIEM